MASRKQSLQFLKYRYFSLPSLSPVAISLIGQKRSSLPENFDFEWWNTC